VYRSIWAEAASAVGAELTELGDGFFELTRGEDRARVWFNWVPLEDIVTNRLALDKSRVHRLLTAAGVHVPDHLEFDLQDAEGAARFAAQADRCVVKPASGTSGGDGVTSGVRTPEEFLRARLRAGRASARLLVEHQAQGLAYRLLFLEGELLDVVRRRPPAVVGDGRSTVADLVTAENRRRREAGGWEGFRLLTIDLDAVLALERQGVGVRSVLPPGHVVTVKGVESQNAARENETVKEAVSPELIAEGRTAVAAVGLRLGGVDVVTSDISRPLDETGGVVVEVNGTPGFQYHYLVADRAGASPVAVPILRRVLEKGG
jgi:cyanophycin synthetase